MSAWLISGFYAINRTTVVPVLPNISPRLDTGTAWYYPDEMRDPNLRDEAWTHLDGALKYYHMTDQLLNFEDAIRTCEGMDATLWCPLNHREHEYVFYNFHEKRDFDWTDTYTGFYRMGEAEHSHIWPCRSNPYLNPVEDIRWSPGEPNHHITEDGRSENCVATQFFAEEFNDVTCDSYARAVCMTTRKPSNGEIVGFEINEFNEFRERLEEKKNAIIIGIVFIWIPLATGCCYCCYCGCCFGCFAPCRSGQNLSNAQQQASQAPHYTVAANSQPPTNFSAPPAGSFGAPVNPGHNTGFNTQPMYATVPPAGSAWQ